MTPMIDYLGATLSLCAECGRLIPARVQLEADGAWLFKECPAHGPQSARVYGDATAYARLGRLHRPALAPLVFGAEYQGCPDSCGLCPNHEQHVCLPILEITDYCDLDCPICLVQNPGTRHLTRAEVATILDTLLRSEGQIDVLNLSGGEPTVNPQFRSIIEEAVARPEILRVSVSTNGRRLAQDPWLLEFLAARRVIVSLQFDGLDDEVCAELRGEPFTEEKLRLIDSCRALGLAMSLTVTAVRGVNEGQFRSVAELLFEHDHVLSVMFQPAAYLGHAAARPRPSDALTIPDVLAALNGAASGTVSAADFSPLPCSHPACFSLAFYLKLGDGTFQSIKRLVPADAYLNLIQNRALFGLDADNFRLIQEAIYEVWSGPVGLAPDSRKALQSVKRLLEAATAHGGYTPAQAWQAAERSLKSIFIHQFMDRYTFDLSRARKCCQVYPQPDGRLVPACVHNCLRRSERGVAAAASAGRAPASP